MTSIEFHNARRRMRSEFLNAITRATIRTATQAVHAFATWRKHRHDRAAFMQLLDKEDWIYEDMGINRADTEWAAQLPLHVNAAKELEKLRARNVEGR